MTDAETNGDGSHPDEPESRGQPGRLKMEVFSCLQELLDKPCSRKLIIWKTIHISKIRI